MKISNAITPSQVLVTLAQDLKACGASLQIDALGVDETGTWNFSLLYVMAGPVTVMWHCAPDGTWQIDSGRFQDLPDEIQKLMIRLFAIEQEAPAN